MSVSMSIRAIIMAHKLSSAELTRMNYESSSCQTGELGQGAEENAISHTRQPITPDQYVVSVAEGAELPACLHADTEVRSYDVFLRISVMQRGCGPISFIV